MLVSRIHRITEEGWHTVGIQSQEPVLLLLICRDVDQCRSELKVVFVFQFFHVDLYGLTIGRALTATKGQIWPADRSIFENLRDEMKAFGILHVVWRVISIKGSHSY